MEQTNRTKLFLIAAGLIFGLLLLLGFVAPPGAGGKLPEDRAGYLSQVPPGDAISPEPPQQFTCSGGIINDMGITVDGATFTAVGELTATTPTGMYVKALPGQLVLAAPAEGSSAHGYLAGDVVRASGVVTADGTYQATSIAPACNGVAVSEITLPTEAPAVVRQVAAGDEQLPLQIADGASSPDQPLIVFDDDGDDEDDDGGEDDDDDRGRGRGDRPEKDHGDKHDDGDDD